MPTTALALHACAALLTQLVLAPDAGRAAGEVDGSKLAFVELRAPRAVYYEREVVPITLRVGVQAEFARKNLLQLFVQPLDLPVQVRAAWLAQPTGARLVRETGPDAALQGERFTFALDDELARATRAADEQRDGGSFLVLELEHSFLVERSGELHVPAPSLRFACATRFEPDFFQEERPVDWQLAHAEGDPLTLRIEPLPNAGRPPSFAGAVGHFTISAATSAHLVSIGERLDLRVVIEGQGNTEFFDAPRFAELADFTVFGVLDEKTPTKRTLTLDIAPRSDRVTAIPALELSHFDPRDSPGYRSVRTDPIPLQVREYLDSEELNEAAKVVALFGIGAAGTVAASLVLVFVLAGLWIWLRRRNRENTV